MMKRRSAKNAEVQRKRKSGLKCKSNRMIRIYDPLMASLYDLFGQTADKLMLNIGLVCSLFSIV